jgi:hypothetical protein
MQNRNGVVNPQKGTYGAVDLQIEGEASIHRIVH